MRMSCGAIAATRPAARIASILADVFSSITDSWWHPPACGRASAHLSAWRRPDVGSGGGNRLETEPLQDRPAGRQRVDLKVAVAAGGGQARPVRDPRICAPAIRGQLLLFRPRRQLTDAHARRIKHRDLAGYEQLKDTAIALAAERGLSKAWWRGTCLMLRLVLAVREADGDDLIPEETLDDLPRSATPSPTSCAAAT